MPFIAVGRDMGPEELVNRVQERQRRFDMDWLRVIAFGILIYFHAAVAFIPSGVPLILNAKADLSLSVIVAFLHQFRLALLFLVAGFGTYFSLTRRCLRQFMAERSRRLLVPLLFGVLVLVPPMVYLEKRYIGEIDGSFLDFYPMFFISGVYPEGHLSWHHFWFVAYLFVFCVAAIPLFCFFRTTQGSAWLTTRLNWVCNGLRIYWFILPLLILEIPLRAAFPGFPDLISDWASFTHWFLIFLAGYSFARNPELLDHVQELGHRSLVLALISTSLLFGFFWDPVAGITPFPDSVESVTRYLAFCIVRMSFVWLWLLTCLGYASRYLQRPGPVLSYLNRAVYPIFCLHLTLIVALDYLVIPLDWSIPSKFLTISVSATIGGLLIYEFVIRRFSVLWPVFGLRRYASQAK